MELVDLFSGTGGFSVAFENLNVENRTIFANDLLDSSQKTFLLNFPHTEFQRADIFDIKNNVPKCDVITGGFPCQPFSIAGKRLGFEDERSRPIFDILSILNRINPEFFILENVKNLLTHNKGESINMILDQLSNFYIQYKVLDASVHTGIPQHRERLYIVGSKRKRLYDLEFEMIDRLPVQHFLEENVTSKYYYTNNSTIYPLLKDIQKGVFYQYRRTFLRENKSGVCPTLTHNMGTGGHNVPIIRDVHGPRKLTPRECFNLQGFPSKYSLPKLSDAKLYSLAGNAVNVKMVEMIMKRVFNAKIAE